MSSTALFYAPRVLLTVVALITGIVPYIADYNVTHVFNPKWPGHAKFHNGQTMSMGVYLGLLTFWKTWSPSSSDDHLWTATVLAAAYYITQFSAYYYPGATAWDPPQHFDIPHVHMFVVMPMLTIVGVAYGLEQWRLAWRVPIEQVGIVGSVVVVVAALFLAERTRVGKMVKENAQDSKAQ